MENDTRNAIIWATLRLQATHPFDPVTLEKVAGDVGISKTAIYHYFPSKEALLQAVRVSLDKQGGTMWEHILKTGLDPLEAFTSEMVARRESLFIYANRFMGFDPSPLFLTAPVFGLKGEKGEREEFAFRAGIFFLLAFDAIMKQNLTQEQVPDFVADVRRWYEKGLGVDFSFDQALWDASAVDPSSLEDDRILDALDRLFASSGIRGVTMERLSRETGMAQSSFYYRFKNKEELVSETGKRELARFLTFLDGRLAFAKDKVDALHIIFGTTSSYYFARPWLSRMFAVVAFPGVFLTSDVFSPFPHLSSWVGSLSELKANAGELALFLPLLPPMRPTEQGWGRTACEAHAKRMLLRFVYGSDMEVS